MRVETPLRHALLVVIVLVSRELVVHALYVSVGRRLWKRVGRISLGRAVCVRKRISASEYFVTHNSTSIEYIW